MIWQLCNRLFGWDYVAWRNCADQGIARVYTDGEGAPYYFRYRGIKCIDRIERAGHVIWLTCSSSKYLKGDK